MVKLFRLVLACLLLLLPLSAQTDIGDLRLSITDAAGLPISAHVKLVSDANRAERSAQAAEDGAAEFRRLPYGIYHAEIERSGFSTASLLIEIRSSLPVEKRVTLTVAPIETALTVTDADTLVDPHRTDSAKRIGPQMIQNRPTAPPGRSLLDLAATQPGWVLEANGVLHPRGSEYDTQYVIDGVPLTDNRSPAFLPDPDVDSVQSMNILTANYPAEYGRKLGGVIEVTTERDPRPGFHGKANIYGGSFDTFGGYLEAQYGWARNTISISGDSARTDRFLDPPVEQNFTNQGTTGDINARFDHDFSDSDRLGVIFRHEQSRFLVPNEFLQQQAGQRQDRDNGETAGQISYQHIFSPHLLADAHLLVRDVSAALWSNPLATPIYASQDRGFHETYLKAALAGHYGRHDWKIGTEADFGALSERFSDVITDPTQFDPDVPPSFAFRARARDREQSLFAQDLIRLGPWTITAGLRFDHYRLLVDESAVSPRLGVAYFWRPANIVFRASYDRAFQTPAFENLLLASSPDVAALSTNVLRLPVRPSHGNFYQAGFSKALFGKIRLDANFYRRDFHDFSDDDLLLNTGVSFPIAFRRAEIHGVEVQLELPRWNGLSGFISYSNMRGTGDLPVTGGLFLGSDAAGALSAAGSFPVSQDQRNTVSSRARYEITSRFSISAAASYGSGLPVEFAGSQQDALAQYGSRIVDRVNFSAGRVRPSFSFDASAAFILSHSEHRTSKIQVDGRNLTDRLNVINFAGLLSGTALAPPRSVTARLAFEF